MVFQSLANRIRFRLGVKVYLLGFSLVVIFFIGEALSQQVSPHPILGMRFAPNGLIRLDVSTDPRGYFRKADLRESRWRLYVNPGHIAKMELPADTPELVRVAIEQVTGATPWGVQFNLPRLSVKAKQRYAIRFRGRADSRRSILLSVSRAEPYFTYLGLLPRDVQFTPTWHNFMVMFTATADEDNAQIQFDLGTSDVSVEFSDVTLHRLPDRAIIEPDIGAQYSVTHRFNALGCRGQDYPIPRPAGTVRILALGDSYTLGWGVHEEDTFVSQLEQSLNVGEKTGYEVINGSGGLYSTRGERLFYEQIAAQYEPDIVLLTMVWDDDWSFLDETDAEFFHTPEKLDTALFEWSSYRRVTGMNIPEPQELEKLLHDLPRLRQKKYQRGTSDFSATVEEVLRLHQAVEENGARLAVVFFRNIPQPRSGEKSLLYDTWQQLITTITKGIKGYGIPTLDIGDALFENHSVTELLVYSTLDHPNEIAHAIAAREIHEFLRREKLLQ